MTKNQQICQLYQDGQTYKYLQKRFHKSQKTIKLILIDNQIKLRTSSQSHQKYKINSMFLKNPHNFQEKQAYLLGWIASDGYVCPRRKDIQLRLQESDKRILEILKDIIEYTGPLIYLKRHKINALMGKSVVQNRWGLVFRDHLLADDLFKLGFTNNKSDDFRFPSYLNEKIMPHFIRSYFEGDGSIYCDYKNNTIQSRISIIATEEFCWAIKNFLEEKLNINSCVCENSGGYFYYIISGYFDGIKFLNYIYNNASFVLDRKFKKYIQLINFAQLKLQNPSLIYKNNKNYKLEINRGAEIYKQILKSANF